MDLICLRLSTLPLLLCRDNAALFVAVEGGVPLFHEGERVSCLVEMALLKKSSLLRAAELLCRFEGAGAHA